MKKGYFATYVVTLLLTNSAFAGLCNSFNQDTKQEIEKLISDDSTMFMSKDSYNIKDAIGKFVIWKKKERIQFDYNPVFNKEMPYSMSIKKIDGEISNQGMALEDTWVATEDDKSFVSILSLLDIPCKYNTGGNGLEKSELPNPFNPDIQNQNKQLKPIGITLEYYSNEQYGQSYFFDCDEKIEGSCTKAKLVKRIVRGIYNENNPSEYKDIVLNFEGTMEFNPNDLNDKEKSKEFVKDMKKSFRKSYKKSYFYALKDISFLDWAIGSGSIAGYPGLILSPVTFLLKFPVIALAAPVYFGVTNLQAKKISNKTSGFFSLMVNKEYNETTFKMEEFEKYSKKKYKKVKLDLYLDQAFKVHE